MRQSVVKAIAEFGLRFKKYGTPSGAKNKCRVASGKFIDFLLARNIQGGFVDEMCVVDGTAHKASVIDGEWVDWTWRQFDPKADFPKISRWRV